MHLSCLRAMLAYPRATWCLPGMTTSLAGALGRLVATTVTTLDAPGNPEVFTQDAPSSLRALGCLAPTTVTNPCEWKSTSASILLADPNWFLFYRVLWSFWKSILPRALLFVKLTTATKETEVEIFLLFDNSKEAEAPAWFDMNCISLIYFHRNKI